ncbi:hypothetical protein CC79DRAFT_157837 [Sarocladium strictum]
MRAPRGTGLQSPSAVRARIRRFARVKKGRLQATYSIISRAVPLGIPSNLPQKSMSQDCSGRPRALIKGFEVFVASSDIYIVPKLDNFMSDERPVQIDDTRISPSLVYAIPGALLGYSRPSPPIALTRVLGQLRCGVVGRRPRSCCTLITPIGNAPGACEE